VRCGWVLEKRGGGERTGRKFPTKLEQKISGKTSPLGGQGREKRGIQALEVKKKKNGAGTEETHTLTQAGVGQGGGTVRPVGRWSTWVLVKKDARG